MGKFSRDEESFENRSQGKHRALKFPYTLEIMN